MKSQQIKGKEKGRMKGKNGRDMYTVVVKETVDVLLFVVKS